MIPLSYQCHILNNVLGTAAARVWILGNVHMKLPDLFVMTPFVRPPPSQMKLGAQSVEFCEEDVVNFVESELRREGIVFGDCGFGIFVVIVVGRWFGHVSIQVVPIQPSTHRRSTDNVRVTSIHAVPSIPQYWIVFHIHTHHHVHLHFNILLRLSVILARQRRGRICHAHLVQNLRHGASQSLWKILSVHACARLGMEAEFKILQLIVIPTFALLLFGVVVDTL
mmetsp:Transcript_34347/g.72345  ORF Transcript_34347/g.72345 Transcript_34347/m.72345 type:complete len:224 (+) Transcript_34347:1500-2171(+)